jgi:di/tricarboxylate transporter
VVTKVLKTIDSERAGLNLLDSSVMDLPGFGSEMIELVLSDQNPFIGRVLRECSAEFSLNYKVAIISARSRNSADPQPSNAEVDDDAVSEEKAELAQFIHTNSRDVVLGVGDAILCLAKTSDIANLVNDTKGFYVTTTVGAIPVPMSIYGLIPVVFFVAMITLVAAEKITMAPASIAVAAVLFLGGWLKGKDITELVDLRLLMLMGCSISFAASMQKTGLGLTIAKAIVNSVNPSPQGALYLVYLITLLVTELLSNNAAAALMYPISVALAKELNVNVVPFAYIILIAATAAFMSPVGYQTHVMVWGPGGYKFMDFVKFGFIPNVIFWVCTCAIVPLVYPL